MIQKRVTKNIFLITTYLLVSLSFISSVLAADVAYIYRKDFKIDKNIINVFSELGLSFDLINENNLPIDFSQYKLIFVGDEKFVKANEIPIGQLPSVILNYYHAGVWGLTDADGVSQLGSTAPLTVMVDNESVKVYTTAFKERRIAVPYYFLDKENKANSLTQIAATKKTSSGEKFGDVISYVEPGSILFNGKEAQQEMCFFGIVASDFWTNETKEMFKDCIEFAASSCQTDDDCPAPSFSSEPYCLGDDIFQVETSYMCLPASQIKSCVGNEAPVLLEQCEFACSEGSCVRCDENLDCNDLNPNTEDICVNPNTADSYCSNESIGEMACSTDLDCGEDGFLDELACFDSNVTDLYVDFTCLNPGTEESICYFEVEELIIETCEFGCEAGICLPIPLEGIHDVMLIPDFSSAIGGIKLETTNGTDILEGDNLMCSEEYKVYIKAKNVGNFTENVTYFGDVDSVNFSHVKTNNLGPGNSTSEKSRTVNFSLSEGFYNITIEAFIEGFSDANPFDNIAMREVYVSCQPVITACFTDEDCPADSSSGLFCSQDDVFQNATNYTCLNPGTESSSCIAETTRELITDCMFGCSGGVCLPEQGEGVHDVALIDFADAVNKIKIALYGNASEIIYGNELICNTSYRVTIKVNNTGDYTENVTFNSTLGDIDFSHRPLNDLLPGDSETKWKKLDIPLDFAQGDYAISIQAFLEGFADANPLDNIAIRNVHVSCEA